MYYVYILRCGEGSYYTGQTNELERRLYEHAHRLLPGFTSQRLPIKLVYREAFPTRKEAMVAEQRIKGWSRKKKEVLIRGCWS